MHYQFGSQQYIRTLLSRINHLHNRAVRIVCGLHKSEHVSRHRQAIGWLSVPLLTQHRTLFSMLDQYKWWGILLNPPMQFGRHHTHNTRCLVHFAIIARCRLELTKRHFQHKAINYIVEPTATATFQWLTVYSSQSLFVIVCCIYYIVSCICIVCCSFVAFTCISFVYFGMEEQLCQMLESKQMNQIKSNQIIDVQTLKLMSIIM